MSGKHALLSPSGAHRWLNCTRSVRLEEYLRKELEAQGKTEPESIYAAEGTLAHSVCEATVKLALGEITRNEFDCAMFEYKADALWQDEMLKTAEIYRDHLMECANGFKHTPYIKLEVSVDISNYAPEAFGRCDCVMIGDETLVITDYKHGVGVPVKVERNPQLMLYALGALDRYKIIFGDTIKTVKLCVDQPRIGAYNTWQISTDELAAWGEGIKPIARLAYDGEGDFKAGDWCQFCLANGNCAAQAKHWTAALDDFISAGENPELLSPEQMSEALKKGANLVDWYNKLKEKSLESILAGKALPGWKAVEGRSIRAWSNQDAALEKLLAQGFEKNAIYDLVPKSLAKLEKLIGEKDFESLVGEFITRPQGKPTLAPESDKRPAYNSAAADFAAA